MAQLIFKPQSEICMTFKSEDVGLSVYELKNLLVLNECVDTKNTTLSQCTGLSSDIWDKKVLMRSTSSTTLIWTEMYDSQEITMTEGALLLDGSKTQEGKEYVRLKMVMATDINFTESYYWFIDRFELNTVDFGWLEVYYVITADGQKYAAVDLPVVHKVGDADTSQPPYQICIITPGFEEHVIEKLNKLQELYNQNFMSKQVQEVFNQWLGKAFESQNDEEVLEELGRMIAEGIQDVEKQLDKLEEKQRKILEKQINRLKQLQEDWETIALGFMQGEMHSEVTKKRMMGSLVKMRKTNTTGYALSQNSSSLNTWNNKLAKNKAVRVILGGPFFGLLSLAFQ